MPCQDEKNKSLGPKASTLRWYSGERSATPGSAAISGSRDNFATANQRVCPMNSEDKLLPKIHQMVTMTSSHRLRRNPPRLSR